MKIQCIDNKYNKTQLTVNKIYDGIYSDKYCCYEITDDTGVQRYYMKKYFINYHNIEKKVVCINSKDNETHLTVNKIYDVINMWTHNNIKYYQIINDYGTADFSYSDKCLNALSEIRNEKIDNLLDE